VVTDPGYNAAMAERSRDWLRQAEAGLRAARDARESEHFEWAAFASHQVQKKLSKVCISICIWRHGGHAVVKLLEHLPKQSQPNTELVDRSRELDKHYIPTRCPNGFERGAPVDYYTRREADRAIENAEAILEFCKNILG
jgi:HEPN domain-containing protein